MRGYVALFGALAGAVVALGRMSAEQLQHVGQALLSLTQAYGLTLLPWALAALLAWLWWRQRKQTVRWIDRTIDLEARLIEAQQPKRKRVAR